MLLSQNVNLYAEVNGKVMPVTISSDDAKYQVSLRTPLWNSSWVFPTKSKSQFTINEKMIFEIRPTITLQSSLTMSVVWWWQRDLAKSLLHVQSFCLLIRWCFFIFLFPSLSVWLLELTSSVTMRKNSHWFHCKTDNLKITTPGTLKH